MDIVGTPEARFRNLVGYPYAPNYVDVDDGQDWDGLIGLRLVAENPGRFARVVAANPA